MSATPVIESAPLLRLEHVSKVFCDSLNVARKYAITDILRPRRDRLSHLRQGEWVALRDVSFELNAGKTLLVLGGPRAGKTALADVISGQRAPDTGHIERRGSVGLLGGGKYGQNPFMKLREHLKLVAALQGVHASDLKSTVDKVLEWTDLTDYQHKLVFDLPRPLVSPLALVSSLLVEHDIYVFDDYRLPRIDDRELERRVLDRFEKILNTRACILLASSSHAPVKVDEVLILHGGEIIFRGAPDDGLQIFESLAQRLARRSGWRSGMDGHRHVVPPVDETRVLVQDLLRHSGTLESAVEREVDALAALQRPIAVGPCLSEMPWEVMFWLPFVKWAERRLGETATLAVSRSAPSSWYAGLAHSFVDVADLMSAEEYRQRDEERQRETGSLKQSRISKFERDLIRRAAEHVGIPTPEILHPSILVNVSQEVWHGHAAIRAMTSRAVYERLPPIVEDVPGLPPEYVVACFPFKKQFPGTAAVRSLVSELVRLVSQRMPVVILDQLGWGSFAVEDGGRGLHIIKPEEDARRAAWIRASVIGRAQAVMGTLNSAITLAPFLGVPSVSLCAPNNDRLDLYTYVMQQAAEQMAVGLMVGAIGSVTANDAIRWLDGALEGRASTHAGIRG